jgi:hypothetical protein
VVVSFPDFILGVGNQVKIDDVMNATPKLFEIAGRIASAPLHTGDTGEYAIGAATVADHVLSAISRNK